jgi:hypothetical protein
LEICSFQNSSNRLSVSSNCTNSLETSRLSSRWYFKWFSALCVFYIFFGFWFNFWDINAWLWFGEMIRFEWRWNLWLWWLWCQIFFELNFNWKTTMHSN